MRAVLERRGKIPELEDLVGKLLDEALDEEKKGVPHGEREATKILIGKVYPQPKTLGPQAPEGYQPIKLTDPESALQAMAKLVEHASSGADTDWTDRVMRMIQSWLEVHTERVELLEVRERLEEVLNSADSRKSVRKSGATLDSNASSANTSSC
ncbi:MAG: hypothetical protein AAF196_06175 [Planctomycetota bacterium]